MAFCNQCGANHADGAKFCNACGAPLPHTPAAQQPWAGQGETRAVQAKQPRGWVGVIGAILAVIGTFLNLVEFGPLYDNYTMTYVELLIEDRAALETPEMVVAAAVIVLVAAGGVLYLLARNLAGGIVSIAAFAAYLSTMHTYSLGELDWLIEVLSIGFWTMLAGLIMMVLSMILSMAVRGKPKP